MKAAMICLLMGVVCTWAVGYPNELGNRALNDISSDIEERSKATGTVKWFNEEKGFGFIQQDNGGVDVYAHFSAIVTDDPSLRSLEAGQRVSFDIDHGDIGPHASNIKVL